MCANLTIKEQGVAMIFDTIENIDTYADQADLIFAAVDFVLNFDMSQPDGKYPIEGDDMYAIVQSVTTGDAEEKLFEAHQDHVDVQMVLSGEERQDVVLLHGQEINVAKEYDKEKDAIFFTPPEMFSSVIMTPGKFVVYAPSDAHRPCCAVREPQNIRKVCVKIKIHEEECD
jgi:biofilm protein TabA